MSSPLGLFLWVWVWVRGRVWDRLYDDAHEGTWAFLSYQGWEGLLLGGFSTGAGGCFCFLVLGCGLFFVLLWGWVLSKGVVHPVTVSGLIVYIYPHAIGLLGFLIFL